MLTYDLANFFKAKGIDKPVGWMRRQDIPYNTASKILRGKYKRAIPLKHLEMICQRLWCLPNDLMAWKPDTKAEDVPAHPLQALKRMPENENLSQQILQLSPDKMK